MDSFRLDGLVDGTLQVRLDNRSNPDGDFTLSLYNPSGTSLISTASMSGGHAELTWSVGTVTSSACVQVGSSAGEGGYRLLVDFVGTPPSVTDIKNLTGSSITSASFGQQVRLVGAHLGGAAADTRVTFGGAVAKVVSVTAGEVRVIVPYAAADGDVVLRNANGRSTITGFSVGRSTPLTPFYTDPDDAWYDDVNDVYLNRTMVQFQPDVSYTVATSTLNAVQALDATMRSGWTVVSSYPNLNLFDVEWTWTSTPTADDVTALLEDMAGFTAIGGANGYGRSTDDALMGYDLDMLHSNRDASGAMGQVSFEEARRLFRYSDLTEAPAPAVVLVDSGLGYGDSLTWPSYGGIEFPEARFERRDHDADLAWAEAADPTLGCLTDDSFFTYVHGNSVASVVGAWNDQQPDWLDGAAREYSNTSGILASLDLALVDEDGDGLLGRADEDGESIDYSVVAYADACLAGESTGTPANLMMFASVFEAIAADPELDGRVVSISQSLDLWSVATPYAKWVLDDAVEDLCRGRTVVLSSGNEGIYLDGSGTGLRDRLVEKCGNRLVLVGGSATSMSTGDRLPDSWWSDGTAGANYGESVSIVAPYDGWRFAALNGSTGATGYDSSGIGTSFAAPAVAATIALVQALLVDDGLSDIVATAIVLDAADDISAYYAAPAGAGWRLDIHRALLGAFEQAGIRPAQADGPWLLVADRDADTVKLQAIDPSTSEFDGTSVTTVSFPSTDDCDGPIDVTVDPLGDLGYALCVYSNTIAVFTLASDPQWIDTIPLTGEVSSRAKLTVTPDGILRVATVASGGGWTLESFDTWSGTRHLAEENLGGFVASAMGAAVDPDGARLAFAAYSSGSPTTEDYEVLATPHPRTKAATDVLSYTWTGTRELHTLYALDWYADGSRTAGMFDNYGTSYYSNENIAYLEEGGTLAGSGEFSGACDAPTSIRVHPQDSCGRAAVGCVEASGSSSAGTVVIGAVATDPVPTFVVPDTSIAYPSGYVPMDVEILPDGSAVAMDSYKSGGTNRAYLYPWPTASSCSPSSTASVTLGGSGFDVMSTTFSRPYGIAVSPYLSVSSPRPGTHVYGARPIVVFSRDPRIEELDFDWNDDGTTDCVDPDVADGVSDACILDIADSGTATCSDDTGDCDAVVNVTAILSSGSSVASYELRVPYALPLE